MLLPVCRFVIVAQARSGSTLLRHALNAHPDAVCHGEVLSPQWINGFEPGGVPAPRADVERLLPLRNADAAGFMEREVFGTGGAPMIGFKIVYADLLKNRPLARVALAWLTDARPAVVHLRRRNPLAAFVSLERMRLFGVTHSDAGRWEDVPRVTIDRAELLEFVAEQHDYGRRVDSLFPAAFAMEYETMAQQFPALLAWLGLSPHPFVRRLSKLAPPDLRQAVANYDEVADLDADPVGAGPG